MNRAAELLFYKTKIEFWKV